MSTGTRDARQRLRDWAEVNQRAETYGSMARFYKALHEIRDCRSTGDPRDEKVSRKCSRLIALIEAVAKGLQSEK